MTARLNPAEWIWLAGFTALAAFVGLLAGLDPKLAIAASIGCGFVLLAFGDLPVAVALFTMFSFLEVLPNQGAVLSEGKIGGLLLALAWLARIGTQQDTKSDFFAEHPGASALIGAFLGWVLLSSVWSLDPGVAFGSFGRYFLNALLFMIVFTAVRTRQQAIYVVAAFVIGAVAAAMYGFLIGTGADPTDAGRLGGGSNNPDGLAAFLVVGLALAGGLMANLRRSPGLRLATGAAAALCLLGTFFTVSRAGLVALGVMLIAALVLAGPWRLRIAIAALVISIVTVYYFAALAPPQARERITQATSGEARAQEGRTTLWAVGERMAKANFVKGVGAGNFPNASPHYLLQPGALQRSDQVIDTPLVAHNIYLEELAEGGIVGFVLFASILLFSLRCAVRAGKVFAQHGDRGGEMLARSLAIGLVGLMAAAFFNSMEYNKELWLLLGLCPALLAISKSEEKPSTAVTPSARG